MSKKLGISTSVLAIKSDLAACSLKYATFFCVYLIEHSIIGISMKLWSNSPWPLLTISGRENFDMLSSVSFPTRLVLHFIISHLSENILFNLPIALCFTFDISNARFCATSVNAPLSSNISTILHDTKRCTLSSLFLLLAFRLSLSLSFAVSAAIGSYEAHLDIIDKLSSIQV